jgi:hypothetical protein
MAVLLLLSVYISRGQYVTIPDSMFRISLYPSFGSCFNLINGGIDYGNLLDTTCPAILNAHTLNLQNKSITDLNGIQYFKNLDTLIVSFNNLYTLPILPPNVSYLDCSYNYSIDTVYGSLLSLTYLDCSYNGLSALPVLPQGLTFLNCSSNLLSSLPGLPDSLKTLEANGDNLTALPTLPSVLINCYVSINLLTILPSLPVGLKNLGIGGNLFSQLPTLPNGLTELSCASNIISNFPSHLPDSLLSLNCSSNPIRQLPTLPSGITYLDCRWDSISQLPSLPQSITNLMCNSNPLVSIPTLPSGLILLWCGDPMLTNLPDLPPHLRTLACDSSAITWVPELPDTLLKLSLSYDTLLHCLPELKTIITYFLDYDLRVPCLPNRGIFLPYSEGPYPIDLNTIPLCDYFNTDNCHIFWNISGKAYFDANQDCLFNSPDKSLSDIKVELWHSGNLVQQAFTDSFGFYSFNVNGQFGTYEVGIDTSTLPFILHCPDSAQLTVTLTNTDSISYGNDFAFQCKPGFDIGVTSLVLLPWDNTTDTSVVGVNIIAGDLSAYHGINCDTGVAGNIKLIISGEYRYKSNIGILAPTSVSPNADTVIWNIADFNVVNTQSDFKILIQGDTSFATNACITVIVSPITGDNDTADNQINICYTDLYSFDPNHKDVYPCGLIDTSQQWLIYTVNFQNTGTGPAHNIYILDTLSSLLDASSLQLMGYTPEPFAQVLPGSVLRVNFPDINLPDSAANPTGSIAYFQYKIKLSKPLTPGSKIYNTAYVYFDSNAPVATDRVVDSVACHTYYTSMPKSICQGQNFVFNGLPLSVAGNYTDTLTSSGSCDSIVTLILTVNPIPTASFTATTPLCVGQTGIITYTGTASNAAIYTWGFGGGIIVSGSAQGPYQINWPTAGTPIITLAVTDNSCTSNVVSVPIIVTAIPTSTFTATSSVCPFYYDTITYAGTASNTASYIWDFGLTGTIWSGSGQGPLVVSWPTASTFLVTLFVTDNGCTSPPDSMSVIVNPDPVSDAGKDTAYCSGDSVTIGTSATLGYTYLWTPAFGLSNTTISNPIVGLTNSSDSAIVQTYSVTSYSLGCSSIPSSVVVIVEECLGIPQIPTNNSITIYPNPATDQLFIKTENIQPQTTTIYDVNGRIIQTMPFKSEVDVHNLSSGVYIIELTSNVGVTRKRFVKM